MNEKTLFVKKVGNMINVNTQKGTTNKLQVVLSEKEVRTNEMGNYLAEQDYLVELLGERATAFNLKEGEWLVGTINFSVRIVEGKMFMDARLGRYMKL